MLYEVITLPAGFVVSVDDVIARPANGIGRGYIERAFTGMIEGVNAIVPVDDQERSTVRGSQQLQIDCWCTDGILRFSYNFV